MIEEDYVSFEVAKLLKEKGFNEPCRLYYDKYHGYVPIFVEDSKLTEYGYKELVRNDQNSISDFIASAPTLQIALKYLRKKHKLCIVSIPVVTDDDGDGGCLWNYVISRKLKLLYKSESLYESTETALNNAIKYCLENLI